MAAAISQLSPRAQAVYRNNPDLAAKRAQQVAASSNGGSDAASSTPASDTSSSGGGIELPDFSGVGQSILARPLLVVAALILGLVFFGRFVRPINLSTSQLTTQQYIDQQNRKVALISDTMPGRIIRTNPAKLGAA